GTGYRKLWEAQGSGIRFYHLPKIVDYYEKEDEYIVVMEYVSGQTLADVIAKRKPSASLALEIFPQICEGVTELHEAFDPPLIHRDLKPSNLIISGKTLTIIDLGISRTFRDDAIADTTTFGTPEYAPPEQYGFGQTDCRSDVYAMGMLLYFILTGKTPNPSMAGGYFNDPAIPAYLRPVLSKATAFSPADRYASAKDLLEGFAQSFMENDTSFAYRYTYGLNNAVNATDPYSWPSTVTYHGSPGNSVTVESNSGPFGRSSNMYPGSEMLSYPGNVYPSTLAAATDTTAAAVSEVAAAGSPKPSTRVLTVLLWGWDILLLAIAVILEIICIANAVSPDSDYLKYNLITRIFLYTIGSGLMFLWPCYAVLSKKPLVAVFPFMKKQVGLRGFVTGILVCAAGFAIIVITLIVYAVVS
ncbi:MAG: serine/threonine protein kinase, partial [Eggerthellaceae bacterium]|nr:serine/threonine protein kinase [Eggerthellaceae bacterium]